VKLLALDQVMELSVLRSTRSGNLEPRGLAPAVCLDLGPENLEGIADPSGMCTGAGRGWGAGSGRRHILKATERSLPNFHTASPARDAFRVTMACVSEAGRETLTQRPFLDQPRWDGAIAELATEQHGVIALNQLRDIGLATATVRHRARRGRLHRIHRGVYSVAPQNLLARKGHWMAAVLAAGPGAVLSHRKAAALHGLLNCNRANVEVTVSGRAPRTHPGIDIHRSKTLIAADCALVNNIPCTTVARTLLDLADVIDRRRLERAFDQAEVEEVLDMRAIDDQLRRNPSRPAASKVRALLEEHYIGSTPTESEIEEGFLALCRRFGLPQPEVQQWLYLPDGGPPIRADFLWREQRVVVETDGDKYHGTAQRSRRDARKDQRLTVHGFRPIRTGWRQIFYRPAELGATLKVLLFA
jgi:predicted transcriptional regulator of viral defense system